MLKYVRWPWYFFTQWRFFLFRRVGTSWRNKSSLRVWGEALSGGIVAVFVIARHSPVGTPSIALDITAWSPSTAQCIENPASSFRLRYFEGHSRSIYSFTVYLYDSSTLVYYICIAHVVYCIHILQMSEAIPALASYWISIRNEWTWIDSWMNSYATTRSLYNSVSSSSSTAPALQRQDSKSLTLDRYKVMLSDAGYVFNEVAPVTVINIPQINTGSVAGSSSMGPVASVKTTTANSAGGSGATSGKRTNRDNDDDARETVQNLGSLMNDNGIQVSPRHKPKTYTCALDSPWICFVTFQHTIFVYSDADFGPPPLISADVAPGAVVVSGGGEDWACATCTFSGNMHASNYCEMCGSGRVDVD